MQLARFTAFNDDTEIHDFDLRVDRDGESADCGWGTAEGRYEVFARVDGGEWTGTPLTDVTDDWRNTVDCATAEAWFGDALGIRLDDDCDELARGHWDGACPLEYSNF
jgi:hypothetical protein